MFSIKEKPDLRGSSFQILNFLRILNLVALFLNMAAAWVLIVRTAMTGRFYFFDAVTHFWIFTINVFLTFSELQFGWVKRYFTNNWPVFGPDHGFVWFGVGLIMIACDLLGNLNKEQFDESNLTQPLWRLVLAAGIVSMFVGFTNLVTSFVFRDGENGITARMIRSDGNLATPRPKKEAVEDYYSAHSASRTHDEAPSAGGFGRRVTQLFTKSPFASGKKMQISHPIPYAQDDVESGSDHDHWNNDRASPIMPGLERPPTAMHPAYTGGNKSTRTNTYSVANMDRF